MDIITLAKANYLNEHICCAISDKKCQEGVKSKKNLIINDYDKGYRFKRLDARGKVLIEYSPADLSWFPVNAENYMVINCFWVSGQYKGKGWGKKLFSECITDAKGMNGIIAISSDKKRPFMSEPKFLKKNGFEIVDEADPYFKLWCKKINKDAPNPEFLKSAKSGKCKNKKGLTVYYSDYCPFNAYWNEIVLTELAEEKNIPLKLIKLNSKEDGRKMPVPWILNSVFYNGEFLTQEVKIDKHLEKKMAE